MRFALTVLACALAVANAQYNRNPFNQGRYQGFNQGQYQNQYQSGRYQPQAFNNNNRYNNFQPYQPFSSSTFAPRPTPARASASVTVTPPPAVPAPVVPAPVVPAPVVPVPSRPVVQAVSPARVAADARSAETVKYDNEINPDGSYNYYFETNNGIAAQAVGTPRNLGGNPPVIPDVVQGSFYWTSPEGKNIAITYVADENGYQPQGDSIPVAPEVPAQIARALAYNAKFYKN